MEYEATLTTPQFEADSILRQVALQMAVEALRGMPASAITEAAEVFYQFLSKKSS